MKQRGKKSVSAQIQTVSLEKRRPSPPADLNDQMAALWQQVVGCFEPGYFRPADYPLLESYCRHVYRAGVIDRQLDVMQDKWLTDDEGLKRYRSLLDARAKETAVVLSLARSLRIAQQSRVHRHRAATAVERADNKAPPPWEPK
jgi:phage terminase small subunit